MNPSRHFLIAILSIFLMSCSSSQVKVAVNSGQQLNPDPNNHSLPVVTRIYQLKDKQQFEAANFNSLWKDDSKTLGQDLLSKEEVLIYPGQKENLTPLARHDEAEYIGVVALFRDYKQGEWRSVVPVKRKVKLQLEDNKLAIIR